MYNGTLGEYMAARERKLECSPKEFCDACDGTGGEPKFQTISHRSARGASGQKAAVFMKVGDGADLSRHSNPKK
jgi:hypothetical protein